MGNLNSSFPIRYTLVFFSCLTTPLVLLATNWKCVGIMSNFISFLILMKLLPTFLHLGQYWLWIFTYSLCNAILWYACYIIFHQSYYPYEFYAWIHFEFCHFFCLLGVIIWSLYLILLYNRLYLCINICWPNIADPGQCQLDQVNGLYMSFFSVCQYFYWVCLHLYLVRL